MTKNKLLPIRLSLAIFSVVLTISMPILWVNLSGAGQVSAATNSIYVITYNDSLNTDGGYNEFGGSVNSGGDIVSYDSQYPTSMDKIFVQFYDMQDNLVQTCMVSFMSDGDEAVTGSALSDNTFYKVKVITPTFLNYSLTLTTTFNGGVAISSSSFIIYTNSEIMIEISVRSISDESWITDYNAG